MSTKRVAMCLLSLVPISLRFGGVRELYHLQRGVDDVNALCLDPTRLKHSRNPIGSQTIPRDGSLGMSEHLQITSRARQGAT